MRGIVAALSLLLLTGCVAGASANRCGNNSDPDVVRQCQQRQREAARDSEREQIERERWERAVGRKRVPNLPPRMDLAERS